MWQRFNTSLKTITIYIYMYRIDILGIHDAHEHVKSGNAVPIYKTFNTVKNNGTCRGSGKNKQKNINSLVNLEGVTLFQILICLIQMPSLRLLQLMLLIVLIVYINTVEN